MRFQYILLPITVICILATAPHVHAVPYRDVDKDYLRKPKMPVEWSRTFIPFERRGDSWETVLKWFEDETGTRILFHNPPPTGTFTFINPRDSFGNPRMYSLVDVFDIINEILQGSTKHTLLRNGNILTLIAADDCFYTWQFPRVEPAELRNRGKTEIVETVINLGNLGQDSEIIARQLKKLLGEFGDIIQLENDRYLMRGTVQSLMLAFDYCR